MTALLLGLCRSSSFAGDSKAKGVLPDSLGRLIAAEFPNLRVPTKKDMTGGWKKYAKGNALPYACWGDFNGDGRADAAVILLGAKGWDLVAFHARADGGYDALSLEDRFAGDSDSNLRTKNPAQGFHVFTVKKGATTKALGFELETLEYDEFALFFLKATEGRQGLQFSWSADPESPDAKRRKLGSYMSTGHNN